jgi:hypothetical protein
MDKKMENNVGFKELGILAKKYGFNNILDFSLWVEDNNLVDVLGIRGEDDEEIVEEDKTGRKYRAKVSALKILQLPEVQKELKENPDIHIDKWKEWARKVRKMG